MTLSAARALIKNESDRAALLAVTSACGSQGIINDAAVERLVREFAR